MSFGGQRLEIIECVVVTTSVPLCIRKYSFLTFLHMDSFTCVRLYTYTANGYMYCKQ